MDLSLRTFRPVCFYFYLKVPVETGEESKSKFIIHALVDEHYNSSNHNRILDLDWVRTAIDSKFIKGEASTSIYSVWTNGKLF